jgi:thymidylate synthase
MTEFDRQYRKILQEIMEKGVEELNERTKHAVRALPGKTIEVEGDEGFPLLTLRKIPVKLFVAEQIWFLTGSRRPSEFLNKFTRIWDDFANVDGVVTTAYGYRWRRHFGRDQIELLVKLLEKDPSSRHGVVVTWDQASDGLSVTFKRANNPCPYTFTVNIIGGKLNLHNVIRSNDMILGCPHDSAGFALLQRILAARLGVGVGKYTHTISNAHIYDIHYEAAREIISRQNDHPKVEISLGRDSYERAKKGDEKLVNEIIEQIESQYHPLGSIKGLQIVL